LGAGVIMLARDAAVAGVGLPHLARCVVVMTFALALSTAAAASVSLRHGRRGDGWGGITDAGWNDMACFLELERFGLKAKETDIVYRHGSASTDGSPEVLVVQDQDAKRRTLVFKSTDGKCNPQAGTICAAASPLSGGKTDGALLADGAGLTSGGDSSVDRCDGEFCNADVAATMQSPGSGYIASMAGALTLHSSAPQRILSVGLGAGTLALVLHEVFPDSQQTVVELSSDVVDAARCFGAAGSQFELVTADGRSYLEGANDGEFDAILIDVFDNEDKVPSCFTTHEFFQTSKRKLKPGGVIAMNAHSGATLHNDLADLLPAAKAVFSDVRLGKAPGLANVIVVATQGNATATASPDGASLSLAQVSSHSKEGFDLHAWFASAEFHPASGESKSSGRSDADVHCSAR